MPDKHPLCADRHRAPSVWRLLKRSLLVLAVFVLPLAIVLFRTAAKEPQATTYKQDLSRHFVKQETVKLDTATVAEQVRREGRLSLVTAGQTFDLDLTPHDLRAPTYRAEETGPGGVRRPVEVGPTRTFKGTVRGMDGAQARFSIEDDRIEGMILTGGERYYVEPAGRYSAAASKTDFVLYKASDVIEDAAGVCGSMLDEQINTATKRVASQIATAANNPPTAEAISTFRLAEVATEADYEYVTSLGGSTYANDQILGTMNYVEGIYEQQLGITFDVVYQHTWATPDDPYSATEAGAVLREFADHWNASFSNVARDLSHMWTGRTMNGNVVGVAYLDVVCKSPERSYGVSTGSYSGISPTAHEIGHNFGATHTNAVQGCAGTIMEAVVTYSGAFCQFSRDEITAYANNNSSCLSSTLSIGGRVTDASGAALSYVNVTLSGTPEPEAMSTDQNGNYWFNDLSPSGNYTVTPSITHYSFNPPNQVLNNMTASQTEVNFTATPATYSISGRVTDAGGNTISGVTMTLSGSQTAAVQTDQDGSYTFAGVNALSTYTITPSKTDYVFNPRSDYVSRLSENRTGVDFTGIRYFTVSGRVTDVNGTGINDVKLQTTGAEFINYVYTDANGNYTFPNIVAGGNCTLTPTKMGYTFNPPNRVHNNLSGDQVGADFTATLMYYSISGRIIDTSGAAMSNVTLTLSATRTATAQTATTQTDANGNYTFANLPGDGYYIITAVRAGYVFGQSQPHLYFFGIDGNITNANLTGAVLYNLNVRITDQNGSPVSGVSVNISGSGYDTLQTDADGRYKFTNVSSFAPVTVTPTKLGYTFNPGNKLLSNPVGDQTVDFVATAVAVLQFSAYTHEANERAGRVEITVNRLGDTAAPVSVDYSTGGTDFVRCDNINGRALDRCDFATARDTLRFAAGETSKSFTVIITDDAYAEGTEFADLTLSNPSGGAVLGETGRAALWITDNDTRTQPSLINQNTFFVRQHYIDFLSREPEQAGYDAWLARLNGCAAGDPTCDSVEVSSSFFRSQEFQVKGFFVYRFYKVSLNRMPRYTEIMPDMLRVTALTDAELPGKLDEFTNEWVQRVEFRGVYDSLPNAAYVDKLLQTAGVTLAARDQLISDLNGGAKTRAAVLRRIVESAEVANKEYNEAFVAMQYFGYLRRDPEPEGLAAWLRVINANPADYRTMVWGFVTSTEYKLRFGQP